MNRIAAVEDAIEAGAERAFEFLERLVAAPSELGREAAAQEVVAAELERVGFQVERVSLPAEIDRLPGAGVSTAAPEGRYVVVGRRAGNGPSLLLNGHVDVVPAGPEELWTLPPFVPERRDGWLHGRGAGDMKSGFAMAVLAIEALLAVDPVVAAGELAFVSAVEEECTGNGTLAAAHAGVLADAVFLPECTGLELLLSGSGVLWVEVEVRGRAAHAHDPGAGRNAIEAALPVLAALRQLEAELNEGADGGPYPTNFATFHAGVWQSVVPAVAKLGVRVGFPAGLTPAEVEARVVETVARTAAGEPPELQPRVRANGFRAEPYALAAGHPLARAVGDAHEDVFGARPAVSPGTATTDARFYLNQFGVPALCYGPRARNIHGADEAVELRSIVDGARVLARFMAAWFAGSD